LWAAAWLGAGLLTAALAPPTAAAAPTCWSRTGETVRCESPAALPVGAPLPPEAEQARQDDLPLPDPDVLFAVICVLGSLFGLIFAAPPFDGDWEERGSERE
jgi:hypothetical protein